MNRHTAYDLKQMQSVPLEGKIIMTQQRIRQWYEHFDGQVYVSFSGGKDSTVLKHIVDQMYSDVPAVFVNTGLEYPEIQRFVKDVQAGRWECFNPNVEILRPERRFDEVLKTYGYPAISKSVSQCFYEIKRSRRNGTVSEYREKQARGEVLMADGKKSRFNTDRWAFVLDSDFDISHMCCDVMKKKPSKQYEKQTGKKPIIGTMAEESQTRYAKWMQNGCNAFQSKRPMSKPLSFWTEQDVLHYIKKYDVPYCPVYGDIRIKQTDQADGQINLIDYLGCYEDGDVLETTGCDRTGCIFCMFGCHLEKEPNRFQRLKETHPRQYEYCISGGEMVDGKWQPSKYGLGLGHVLDFIGVPY